MIPSTPAGSPDPAPCWSGHGGIVQVVDLHAGEHFWEVSRGVSVHGYGFNWQVPGPVIEASVGDRLLIQFSNGMDQPSALVWESPSVAVTPLSTSTLHWVVPGGRHRYEFTLTRPGAFLYRATSPPHTPSMLDGLYGVLLVTGPGEPHVDEERIFVVHHAQLTAAHRDKTQHGAPLTQHGAPLMGWPGPSVLLIDGVRHASIDMRAGSRERWRILNAATDVQLRLSMPSRPARIDAGRDCRRRTSDLPVPPTTTLSAAGMDVQIGPFARGEQVSLDAVLVADGPLWQHLQLLTCRVI